MFSCYVFNDAAGSGGLPVRRSYASGHEDTDVRRGLALDERRPEIQQRFGLITALGLGDDVRGDALQIKERGVGSRSRT